ncbi:MAG TPA: glycosyltransferase family 87 protein [Chthoniobacterales bacterium]|nr:glycosyltransferase family 87 protein [Chthoniobacterales bacterium]
MIAVSEGRAAGLQGRLKSLGEWNIGALAVWIVILLGLAIRTLANPNRATAFAVYRLAGIHWLNAQHLYGDWRGFVYSPLAAVFFTPFGLLPPGWGNLCWTWLNSAIFLLGVRALLSSGIYPGIKPRYHGIVYLMLVPLVLGNLDTGQANPTVIGLMLLAVAAVPAERWGVAALCIAASTYLKIYPLTVGLILFLIAPRRLGWRLLLALVVLGILPFLFQHWSYVSQQYHEWISTRSADDRRLYPIKDVPLDLWFLLVRLGHLPIPGFVYSAFQILSGGAIALFCLAGVWKSWPKERLLAGMLALVCIWMTLCGPATELQTYVLLAPAVVLTLLDALPSSRPLWLRAGLLVVCLLMVLAVARTSFLPSQKGLWILTIQPVAAILFLICCLVLFLRGSFWRGENGLSRRGLNEG